MQPQISVIILNWNGSALLRQFLPSVVNHTSPSVAKVIVADNGSTDDSLEVMHREFPQVEIWQFDKNYGFAGGYNKALEKCDTPYAVLLNSDVSVDADWISPMLEYMERNPMCGACQPKILSYRKPECFEYAGAAGGYIDRNGYPYCRGRIFDTVECDTGQYDSPAAVRIFWATGAAMMVRVDVYKEVGGLDEAFFAHMEEIDLCWRMQLAGYTIDYIPASHVYHVGGASLDASNPRKTLLNFRNSLLMLYKNLPENSRRSTLLRRRLLDTLAWAQFIVKGKWGHAAAIWKAHRQFRKMKNTYRSHPAPGIDMLHTSPRRPNILTQYYLHGHKKFSQIR